MKIDMKHGERAQKKKVPSVTGSFELGISEVDAFNESALSFAKFSDS